MLLWVSWKGILKIGELICVVGFYIVVLILDWIVFYMINCVIGYCLCCEFVDSDICKVVECDDQVKGYEVLDGEYILFLDDEIVLVVFDSDKVLGVIVFIFCDGIEDVYVDKFYYLMFVDMFLVEVFGLICDGLCKQEVVVIVQIVLFCWMCIVLIWVYDVGMIVIMLNFDYEV